MVSRWAAAATAFLTSPMWWRVLNGTADVYTAAAWTAGLFVLALLMIGTMTVAVDFMAPPDRSTEKSEPTDVVPRPDR